MAMRAGRRRSPLVPTVLPLPLPLLLRRPSPPARTFFLSPPSPPPLTLHASRTLPYTARSLYALIADIESYPSFIPHCTGARVTARTPADPSGRTHPRRATLAVGFRSLSESFASRVHCVPDRVVEAVCGSGAEMAPHDDDDDDDDDNASSAALFSSLRARWSLREHRLLDGPRDQDGDGGRDHDHDRDGGRPRTDVELSIEVVWKSPIYAAMSRAVAPKLVGKVVEAFEARAREVLGGVGGGLGR